jgi:hypothetical protein
MSAMVAAAAITTAGSLYAQKKASKDAKNAQSQAAGAAASQGYTGSGNALVAAADAGASAYQQEFDNLSRLAGADVGLQSAAGVASTGLQTSQQARSDNLGAIGGVVNNIGNLATVAAGAFNRPAAAPPATGGNSGAMLGPSNGTSWNFGGG